MPSNRQPVLAISHGGGPCFQVELSPPFTPEVWAPLKVHLAELGLALEPRPRAILAISGHWEEKVPTVGIMPEHTLLFDYYGFPAEAYQLRYPAKGAPDVAERARLLLAESGIDSRADDKRGLDHGIFVPFMVMFPDADIPIVPLSLRADLDPAFHIAVGSALASLRDEGVLIIASGNSYHNMEGFRLGYKAGLEARLFGAWLDETMTIVSPDARKDRLVAWEQAPGARSRMSVTISSHRRRGRLQLAPSLISRCAVTRVVRWTSSTYIASWSSS